MTFEVRKCVKDHAIKPRKGVLMMLYENYGLAKEYAESYADHYKYGLAIWDDRRIVLDLSRHSLIQRS